MNKEEELEDKVSELELQIEEMERTNTLIYGMFFALLSHMQWNNWIVTPAVGAIAMLVYWGFFAKKPFTNGLDSSETSDGSPE